MQNIGKTESKSESIRRTQKITLNKPPRLIIVLMIKIKIVISRTIILSESNSNGNNNDNELVGGLNPVDHVGLYYQC